MTPATLLLLAGSLAPAPVQAIARDTAEPVIVELALGRLVSRTLVAYRVGRAALLPVAAVLELAEIRVDRVGDSTLTATVYPSGESLLLDGRTRSVSLGPRRIALEPDDLLVADGALYLSTTALGAALDLDWSVSWTDLRAVALDPSRLPVAERLTREWQRRTRSLAAERLTPERTLAAGRPAVDGLVLDYSVVAPAGRSLREAAFATGLGLDVFGGSLTAQVQSQGAAAGSPVRSDVSWHGVFPESRALTQLRIGDGYATGPAPRALRGVSLGNSPFIRPNVLGEIALAGQLGPGWQVEAYRGGRLIGFDSVNALGRFSIDAPIQYGENPVELVAYGPFGEIRRFQRNLQVDGDRVPGRALEYGLSAGACRTEQCAATANVDLRYGLSSRWTARAGIDRFWRDTLPDLFHPYVAVTGSLTSAVSVKAEVVADAVVRGAVRYDPSSAIAITAEASRFADGVRDPILTVPDRTSQLTATAFVRLPGQAGTFLEASLDRIHGPMGTSTSGRVGVSWQLGNTLLAPAVRWQRDDHEGQLSRQTVLTLNTFLFRLPAIGPVRDLTLRSLLEADASLDPLAATAYLSRNLSRRLRVELGGGWAHAQGATATLTIAANLPTMRSYTTVTHASGRTRGSQYVHGSVLIEPSRGAVHLGPGPSLDRGGVTGRVFLDLNGNERLDPGEQVLPDVRVSVGMHTRVSGDDGQFALWNVTPHEPALVAVDSTTLASPLWVPAYRAVQIRPGPNRYAVVDIPVLPGGVIEGMVVRAADSSGVGGVTLRLEREGSPGDRSIVSFRDGEFYGVGIKPGDYVLRLDPGAAERLGLRADPIRFTMPADVDGATVSGLVLRLR